MRVDGAAADSKLEHVGLADDDGPRRLEPCDGLGVVGIHAAPQELRAGRADGPGHGDVVLHGERQAVQGTVVR